ncbi:MAG: alpha/beta fold hydrolase [Deltaproteobacteria bacterium]|nr:MAG: alpha/beta fold hydrolase [Deltaproteobacteria bacterium]
MPKPRFLFAHGAGAGSGSDWMRAWAERLGAIGPVTPFDYPYMAAGRKAPDRLPKLIAAHREQLAALRDQGDGPIVLVGKSMGSRVGCHLALEEPVAAVICLGYPLRGISKNAGLRDQVLLDLRAPVLFVQGTRDRLCPLDELAAVRARMTAPSALHVVEAGDHSLVTTKGHQKATGTTQEDADAAALAAIRAFVAEHAVR